MATAAPTTQIYGNDTVTAPSMPPGVAGPVNMSNANWTVSSNGSTTIPSPAVVSSGNGAQTHTNNMATYNSVQGGIAANSSQPYDPNTGATWNPSTNSYSGPVSPNFNGSSSSAGTTTQPPASGMDGVTVQQNADGSYTYAATDPTNTNAVSYAQLQNNNLQLQASVQPLLAKVASIANGTYVLSPSEQSQLDAIQQQINQAVQTQQKANNMEMGAQSAWSNSVGATRYGGNSSDLFTGNLATVEAQRISDIQMKGAQTLQAAKQAILDGDAKALNDAISDYQKYASDNSTNIMNLQKISNDALTQAHTALQDQIDQQNANTAAMKAQQQFNKDNNITSQFYMYPGSSQVFNSQTGQPVTQQEYLAAGGKPDFSSIQTISNAPALQSAEGKEYQDYLSTLPAGQKPMSFTDFTKWDANLKTPKTTINMTDTNAASDNKVTSLFTAKGVKDSMGNTAVGSDGYVTPAYFQAVRTAWLADNKNKSASDFNTLYKKYTNPNDPQDYGMGGK